MDVLLELANALRAEGMRYGLSLAGVLGTVSCVEEATLDGDKGIIVVSVIRRSAFASDRTR